jgi:hypothetical protein
MTRLILEGELGDGTKIIVREDTTYGTIRVWLNGIEICATQYIERVQVGE